MRGAQLCVQPVETPQVFVVYNGEIYSDEVVDSDTRYLARLFSQCSCAEQVPEVIDVLEIEASFVCVFRSTGQVVFGRDALGRRSLVMTLTPSSLQVASVALDDDDENEWVEVAPSSLYVATVTHEQVVVRVLERHIRAPIPSPWPDTLLDALSRAVRRRTLPSTLGGPQAELSVLFSGGVDCVAVAAVAHLVLPAHVKITLVNVAVDASCPDRLNALDAQVELGQIFATRAWPLVCVDVGLPALREAQATIVHLMRPKRTVMDFNLGAVLYFGARAAPSRCVLSGSGADELFGGYQRHATRLQRGGAEAWQAETDLELGRLWTRNLGRDDRVVGHHAKELRLPLLDSAVVAFASRHAEPGNKLPLRRLVAQLGLVRAAARDKLAMQFGSRLAKLVKGKGTDVFGGLDDALDRCAFAKLGPGHVSDVRTKYD